MASRFAAFAAGLFFSQFLYSVCLAQDEPANGPVRYYVATLGAAPIDPGLPTRILVAGVSDHLGLMFQEAAAGQGHRLHDVFPQDQIVFVFFNERPSGEDAILRRWGLTVVRRVSEDFDQRQLMDELTVFSRIRSIDIYAHSWTSFARLTPQHNFTDSAQLNSLAWHFTDDAYAFFHGCSAGWGLAADVAKRWSIPVAGALTGTNFEQLHTVGNFYFNDEATKPAGAWAQENSFSFSYTRPCRASGCLRMRPDNRPYKGVHGTMISGLPIYKFFCPEREVDRIKCLRGMAMSVYAQVELSSMKTGDRYASYKTAVQNLLCPIDRASALREDCRQQLQQAEHTGNLEYSPFDGPSAICDWKDCRAPWIWEKTQAFGQEYYHYLTAYELVASRIPSALEP